MGVGGSRPWSCIAFFLFLELIFLKAPRGADTVGLEIVLLELLDRDILEEVVMFLHRSLLKALVHSTTFKGRALKSDWTLRALINDLIYWWVHMEGVRNLRNLVIWSTSCRVFVVFGPFLCWCFLHAPFMVMWPWTCLPFKLPSIL